MFHWHHNMQCEPDFDDQLLNAWTVFWSWWEPIREFSLDLVVTCSHMHHVWPSEHTCVSTRFVWSISGWNVYLSPALTRSVNTLADNFFFLFLIFGPVLSYLLPPWGTIGFLQMSPTAWPCSQLKPLNPVVQQIMTNRGESAGGPLGRQCKRSATSYYDLFSLSSKKRQAAASVAD